MQFIICITSGTSKIKIDKNVIVNVHIPVGILETAGFPLHFRKNQESYRSDR